MQAIFSALTLALAASPIAARHTHPRRQTPPPYHLQDNYTSSPEHFFSPSSWSYDTQLDPTHGSVTYIPAAAAAAAGLLRYVAPFPTANTTATTPGAPIYIGLGAPSASSSSTQRASVRMLSAAVYNADTLIVADIAHLPSGCGTWPALWMLNTDLAWPDGGEWDIVENVNGVAQVAVSLHADAGCAVSPSSSSSGVAYSGTLVTPDCDVHAPNQARNTGCSVLAPEGSKSFGDAFNGNGGGVFAAEWTRDGFRVWFFARDGAAAWPASLLSDVPDTATFGQPVAAFAGDGCDWAERFHDMRLVIDTTLCGDWAGAEGAWGEECAVSTGMATCEEWVASAGEKGFEEAYWEINGLRTYVR